jgi:hypothetical protein
MLAVVWMKKPYPWHYVQTISRGGNNYVKRIFKIPDLIEINANNLKVCHPRCVRSITHGIYGVYIFIYITVKNTTHR